MNRRSVVKKLAFASGSLITLPFWMTACTGDDHVGTHLSSFSITEQDILAAVVDTIIPAGNQVGALAVGIDKYLQKLIDKCYEKDVQDNVKSQLHALDEAAQSTYHYSFSKCHHEQRQLLLQRVGASEKKTDKDFFTLIKSETINGFTTSKDVMINYFHYQVAPGHYYGCMDIKT